MSKPTIAKRAGLLHDIGKVPSEESELPHAILGMQWAEKYGEKPEVCEWPLLEDKFLDDALNDLAWKLGTNEDQHATAYYRRSLIRSLGRRVVGEALACLG